MNREQVVEFFESKKGFRALLEEADALIRGDHLSRWLTDGTGLEAYAYEVCDKCHGYLHTHALPRIPAGGIAGQVPGGFDVLVQARLAAALRIIMREEERRKAEVAKH